MSVDPTPAPSPLEARPRARQVLSGSMFLLGACGMIYEYTLGSLGNNLIGSSYEQIFVVIGLMMFAMGIGASLQSRFHRDLLDTFLFVEILLGYLGGIAPIVIYAAFATTSLYQLTMYAFALVIGGLIGLEVPLLIRINEQFAGSLKSNLGDILTMDYVGSLAGALLFAYVLLTRLTLFRIALSLGLVNTAIALVGLVYFWPWVRRKGALLGFAAFTVGVLVLGLVFGGRLMVTLEQRTYADPIILSKTTQYQHIVMTRYRDRVRLFINGNLQFDSRDEHIYHEMLVHMPMALRKQRRRVLILGGGDGLALREVLKYPDVEQVDLVDIDPAITELAARHPDLLRLNEGAFHDARLQVVAADGITPGERIAIERPSAAPHEFRDPTIYATAEVRVFNVDADRFLRDLPGRYDVVVSDFPDPGRLELAKLYSVDFYRQVARHLAPGGIMALQSTSPFHSREMFLCIGKTLETAGFTILPYRQNVPSFGEWGWHLAWQGTPTPEKRRASVAAIPSVEVPTRFVTPEILEGALAFGKTWLDRRGIRVNTKMRPVLVEYHRLSWR